MSDEMSVIDPLEPEAGRGSGRVDANDGTVSLFSDNWPRVDDGLQIRSGGIVAVDTATLTDAAIRFDAVREELAEVGRRLGRLQATLRAVPDLTDEARASASVLAAKLEGVQAEAQQIAAALREAGYAYEIVELNAEHRMAVSAGDGERAARLDARISELAADHPGAMWTAFGADVERAIMWPSELVRQATQWGVGVGSEAGEPAAVIGGVATGLGTLGGAVIVGIAGAGRLSKDSRLTGTGGPVTVTPVAPTAPLGTSPVTWLSAPATGASATRTVGSGGSGAPAMGTAATGAVGATGASGGSGATATGATTLRWPAGGAVAPQSLAAATERVPGSGDARVRVERYTMPDGSRQFAVYIAGMQSSGWGGDDPWDNQSNVELYSGQMADSYVATETALAAAGVEAEDAVHVFGFSQGAMIGAHLALEGDYDVKTLVSVGSPVDPAVDAGTLSISVRHTDDPVAGLAGGGHGGAVGAPGSFVAERVFDPDTALDDATLPAHRLTAYADTAAHIDASTDPRVNGIRGVLGELAQADSVAVIEYAATRGER